MDEQLDRMLQAQLRELAELEQTERRLARERWRPLGERMRAEQETLAARARLRTLLGAQPNT